MKVKFSKLCKTLNLCTLRSANRNDSLETTLLIYFKIIKAQYAN